MRIEDVLDVVKENCYVLVTINKKVTKAFAYKNNTNNIYFFQNEFQGSAPYNFNSIKKKYNLNYKYSWAINSSVSNIEILNEVSWWW